MQVIRSFSDGNIFQGSGLMKTPCFNCKDRSLNCHSTCEKYTEYRRAIKEINVAIRMESKLNDNVVKARNRFTGYTVKER